MITRNFMGKIEPKIDKYTVQKRWDEKWEITKQEPFYRTTAVLANPYLMWNEIESFESMVKAYAWLKKHVDELL